MAKTVEKKQTTKVYIGVVNTSSKVVILRQNTTKAQEFLKTQMGDECKAYKVRGFSAEDAFNKIVKQTGIEDLMLDTSRHHNLAEIEEFSFEG